MYIFRDEHLALDNQLVGVSNPTYSTFQSSFQFSSLRGQGQVVYSSQDKENHLDPGVVVHICNPGILEAEAGGLLI